MDFLSGNIIQILEIIGTILGLIYLYYEYRASSSLWIVNIVMSAIYVIIYFSEGIYALGCMSIYNILAAIYGILMWKYSKTSDQKELPITSIPKKVLLNSSIVMIVLSAVLVYVLHKISDSGDLLYNTLDGLASSATIISLYWLAKKYKEQWFGWIFVNFISVVLYLITGLYFTAVLYTLYIIVAVAGYKEWTKLMNNAKA
ncbi:MAG: nicotinamide riboside transporter PnuC [Paludibacteraceae bacterium]|jgi:nicotinamide mononucleotide transporter|nr:nicotinamide riboside transporter PnuC [Paludibacteraceae bacterium]